MLNADALSQLRQLKTDIKQNKVVLSGTVKATQGRFGFVALEDGRDVFLPPEEMQKVLPGDRITLSEQEVDKGKTQGVVESLVETQLTTFVGRYLVKGKGHFVAPDAAGVNRWIFIPPKERQGAAPDDLVYCQIHRHPIKDGKGQARVLKVIGKAGAPGIERAFTLASFDLSDAWPEPVLEQAAALSEEAIRAQAEGREDLTAEPYVTIDNPATQDMDDAVLAVADAEGWRLSVAIADPTALIEPGSPLEQEAFRRGTAIYFPGEPLPMLPDALSTRLCSLMPDATRLALVCDLRVHADGRLGDYRFRQALIRSHGKLGYDQVSRLFDDAPADNDPALPAPVVESLRHLRDLALALRQWRGEHALLGNERPEFRLRLDENKRIRAIEPATQNEAHRLVEECMVAANRCAADFLGQQPGGLFIQHPGLRADRLDNIRKLLAEYAPDLASVDPASSEGFRTLMNATEALDGPLPIKTILSRQLARAELSSEAAPHQGMGLPAYTTFTSPLRKFTDFYVHRLIKARLWQAPMTPLDAAGLDTLQATQLKARQAAGSLDAWLKSDFAKTLGDTPMDGTIVRTVPAGFFVRLDANGLEGFVSCKDLDGKYSFDPVTLRLTHTKNGRMFQLDQRVSVCVSGVDDDRHQIQFRLLEAEPVENRDSGQTVSTE
ncbi:ribonuclease R family protein [Marinobacter sp. C2H3]|uniref:ribonuclease R family protein n=1 Tax=Marinobacter sp. C2H3 TaxID=3119003 RepID=UPI00300E74BD